MIIMFTMTVYIVKFIVWVPPNPLLLLPILYRFSSISPPIQHSQTIDMYVSTHHLVKSTMDVDWIRPGG